MRTLPFLPGPLALEGPADLDGFRPARGCAIMWLQSGRVTVLATGDGMIDAGPYLRPDFEAPGPN